MLIIQKKSKQASLPSIKILALSMSFLSLPTYASNSLWDMSLEELGKIRVTSLASGTATPLDKAAAIATVITAEDIEAMGARDIDEGLCCTNGKGLRVSVKCRDDDLYPSEISHHELANLQCSFEISGLTDALDRQRDVLAWCSGRKTRPNHDV